MNRKYLSEWAREKAANIMLQQPHLSTPLCKHEKIAELIDVVIQRASGAPDAIQPADTSVLKKACRECKEEFNYDDSACEGCPDK